MNPTPDAALLRLLRNATMHLSAGEICDLLHWGPSQLEDRLQVLRECGFEIEQHPLFGIKLNAAPDRLIADDLFPSNPSSVIGSRILVYQEIASTNDTAATFGREGAPEGLVIFAEKQTGGRGRLGRRWESELGKGLYFSLLLRPSLERQAWANFTTWSAVCVARALERFLPCPAQIKWPNDIYLNGKKAVGILSEAHVDKNSSGFAIIGIGINVNQTEFPEEIASRAISLRLAAGQSIDRRELALQIFQEMDSTYIQAESAFDHLVAEADRRSYLKGHWVRLEAGATVVEGVAGGLDSAGGLRITSAEGVTTVANSGEVTVTGIALH